MSQTREIIDLGQGRYCVFAHHPKFFARTYHVLFFPEEQGPPSEREKDSMLLLARHKARECGRRFFNDEECYTIIHNGLGTRRARDTHYHILPLAGRPQKTLFYLVLVIKNLLHIPLRRGKAARLEARRTVKP